MTHRGKIARLPWQIREALNERLREGHGGGAILRWLNSLPAVKAAIKAAAFGGGKAVRAEISPENLSQWRQTGYAEWADKQDDVDRTRQLAEVSLRLAKASGGSVSRVGVSIAAGKLLEQLEAVGSDDLGEIAKTLTAVSAAESEAIRAHTDRERLKLQRRGTALAEQKFQRETVALYLKWREDAEAEQIAGSRKDRNVKMSELITHFFGQPPAAEEEAGQ